MSSLLSLGFEFKDCHHSFLARVKETGNEIEYHVTLMNGELEKLLYGNHIITGSSNHVVADLPADNQEDQHLKFRIAQGLNKYLQQKTLTGI